MVALFNEVLGTGHECLAFPTKQNPTLRERRTPDPELQILIPSTPPIPPLNLVQHATKSAPRPIVVHVQVYKRPRDDILPRMRLEVASSTLLHFVHDLRPQVKESFVYYSGNAVQFRLGNIGNLAQVLYAHSLIGDEHPGAARESVRGRINALLRMDQEPGDHNTVPNGIGARIDKLYIDITPDRRSRRSRKQEAGCNLCGHCNPRCNIM